MNPCSQDGATPMHVNVDMSLLLLGLGSHKSVYILTLSKKHHSTVLYKGIELGWQSEHAAITVGLQRYLRSHIL